MFPWKCPELKYSSLLRQTQGVWGLPINLKIMVWHQYWCLILENTHSLKAHGILQHVETCSPERGMKTFQRFKMLKQSIMAISHGFDKGHNWKRVKGAFSVPWGASRAGVAACGSCTNLTQLESAQTDGSAWDRALFFWLAPRQSNGTNTTVLPKRMTKGRQNYFDYTELDWESQFSVILGQTVTTLNPDHLTAHWTT